MATNYQRGRAFEYRTRNKLTAAGAVYVMRAAQSKGAADLLVLWPLQLQFGRNPIHTPAWLVQCKRDGKLPPAERETLIDLAARSGALPVLARVPKSGRGVEFVHIETKETLVV